MDDVSMLAEGLINRDEKALDSIIIRYTPLVSSVIYNVSNGALSREDIEEAASDTFAALWANAGSFEADKLKGYLCRIAKSKAYDMLDRKKLVPVVDIDEVDIEDDITTESSAESKELRDELKKAIDQIKEPDREILIRHYYYYQKIRDIAAAMGMSPATVKVKLHRTRNRLKKILTERGFTL